MSHLIVDLNLCAKDGACVDVCPTGALKADENKCPVELSEEECLACGHCIAVCPTEAITLPGIVPDDFEPQPESIPAPEQMDALLKYRRSIRAFADRPVDREIILSCLEVARRAPTAKNSQLLNWIVVDGAEKVHELAREMIFGIEPLSTRVNQLEQWQSAKDGMLRGAPMVVVACAPAEYAWGKEDAAIALAYFEMAAKTRGLGVCWAGYLTAIVQVHAPLRLLLKVPEGLTVRGALMVGESEYTYRRIPPRKPLRLQWN